MIDVEVLGAGHLPEGPEALVLESLCEIAAASRGIDDGHVAIEFVDAEKMTKLNFDHRDKVGPTDVLSFPIDGVESMAKIDSPAPGTDGEVPRELGDIVICPECTADVREAVVHGMLHLLGMDHETDDGEMLSLQVDLLARAGGR
jgi:probable rRNA maturation factor